MSQVICPICGKFFSVQYYDPTDFEDDILLVQVRGLGRGKGVEIVEKYSLLDGSDPELLDLISDRVAIIYNMLYEDVEDDEAEEEHPVDLEDDDEDDESLSELEKELRIGEAEEEEEEDEDISDLDEDIID